MDLAGIATEGMLPVPLGQLPAQLCLRSNLFSRYWVINVALELTLTPAPAQTNPASSDWETLHLFNSAFCIRFTHKLNEATVFPNRNLDLIPERTIQLEEFRKSEKIRT